VGKIEQWARTNGGFVASPVNPTSVSRNMSPNFSRTPGERASSHAFLASSSSVTALSVEFVAKPQAAHRVQTAIPAALAGALQNVSGFAGCLVMVSEQEARLVTVITLWVGNDRVKQCRENLRWVHKLLAPYVDRCLRVQTLAAHSPALPGLTLQMNFENDSSAVHCRSTEDETACVA
jgi:hypothetical protein